MTAEKQRGEELKNKKAEKVGRRAEQGGGKGGHDMLKKIVKQGTVRSATRSPTSADMK